MGSAGLYLLQFSLKNQFGDPAGDTVGSAEGHGLVKLFFGDIQPIENLNEFFQIGVEEGSYPVLEQPKERIVGEWRTGKVIYVPDEGEFLVKSVQISTFHGWKIDISFKGPFYLCK